VNPLQPPLLLPGTTAAIKPLCSAEEGAAGRLIRKPGDLSELKKHHFGWKRVLFFVARQGRFFHVGVF